MTGLSWCLVGQKSCKMKKPLMKRKYQLMILQSWSITVMSLAKGCWWVPTMTLAKRKTGSGSSRIRMAVCTTSGLGAALQRRRRREIRADRPMTDYGAGPFVACMHLFFWCLLPVGLTRVLCVGFQMSRAGTAVRPDGSCGPNEEMCGFFPLFLRAFLLHYADRYTNFTCSHF